jgi:predicted MFS family arabinose efflux permease
MAQGVSLGRFVFTPMLPMMLKDGSLTLPEGGALATANYVGYLAGALLCLFVRADAARMVRAALVFAILLTIAMAAPGDFILWAAWRGLAGICCAFVMVFTTTWSQQRLAQLGRPELAGLMFCGPGIGVILTSVPAIGMTAAHWPARTGWAAFSVLGVAMTLPVWRVLRSSSQRAPMNIEPSGVGRVPNLRRKFTAEAWSLAIVFGLAGFGYIIIATFLPIIARRALPGSSFVDLFWPIFGVGVTVGAWVVTRIGMHHDNRRLLMLFYVVQATGVGTIVVWPTVPGFILCSLLVGVPFLAITSIAMREARRLWPGDATGLIGLLTTLYATGQIAGPLLATTLVARTNGFGTSLCIAVAALLVGAFGCLAMLYVTPIRLRADR